MNTAGELRSLSLGQALVRAKEILQTSPALVDQGRVETEAELLACYALQTSTDKPVTRLDFYSKINNTFPDPALSCLLKWSELRAQGHLLQHLTGFQTFLDHEYEVGPQVLIPRTETELLFSKALEVFKAGNLIPQLGFEIGLGSGILSIELLSHFQSLKMMASEISEEARIIALKNASRILDQSQARLTVLRAQDSSEVWQPFDRVLQQSPDRVRADFLITNPPYLSCDDPIDQDVLDHEPRLALFPFGDSKSDSLFFYRAIAEQAHEYLTEQGVIFAEIPHQRSMELKNEFESSGFWSVEIFQDLNKRDRVLVATRKGSHPKV